MPLPRGLRNNNPLNLTQSPWTSKQSGYAGTDAGGRYARFNTPEDGIAAAGQLLHSYMSRGYNTPASIVGRWAPSSENGPSTNNYTNYVSQQLGVQPNTQLSDNQVTPLVTAMGQFENGRQNSAGMIRPQKPQPAPALAPDIAPSVAGYGMGDQMPLQSGLDTTVGKLPAGPPKFFSKNGAAPYLFSAIGDAFAIHNDQEPTGVKNIMAMNADDKKQSFDREKWNAELELERQKMLEPPADFQTADYYNKLPQPQQQSFLAARDSIAPIVADYVDGAGVTHKGVYSRTDHAFAGGGDTQVIDGKTYQLVGGQWHLVPTGAM